jgi:ketosteroid isomerase-like protein
LHNNKITAAHKLPLAFLQAIAVSYPLNFLNNKIYFMSTLEAVMTTQDVANRYMELEKVGNWMAIQDELYSQDAVSIEPEHAAAMGMQTVTNGIDAIKAKGKAFNESIEEVHGGYCSEPVTGGNFFSVAMGMDCTMKGAGRMKMDEIAVFEVKDGKIVKEQFFF